MVGTISIRGIQAVFEVAQTKARAVNPGLSKQAGRGYASTLLQTPVLTLVVESGMNLFLASSSLRESSIVDDG